MIEPTDADIGRRVTYVAFGKQDSGVITSFNDEWVFVRYDYQNHTCNGQATDKMDLVWGVGNEYAMDPNS